MSADNILTNATRVTPPGNSGGTAPNKAVETSLTSGAVSAVEIAAAATPAWYSFAVSVAFNIAFGDTSTITNPANNSAFPAGVYSFYITAANRFLEVLPSANGGMVHWKSSLGSE